MSEPSREAREAAELVASKIVVTIRKGQEYLGVEPNWPWMEEPAKAELAGIIDHFIQRAITAAEERARAGQAATIAAQAAEIERLKAGGCARDQGLTQFCAEAVALRARIEAARTVFEFIAGLDHDCAYEAIGIAKEALKKGQPQ